MYRILAAAAVAALIGGTALVTLGGTERVEAHGITSGKSDRLDIKTSSASTCSQTSWPYYQAGCLRNTVTATRDVRPVRIVTTDRLPL